MKNNIENPVSSNSVDIEADLTSPEIPPITGAECLEMVGLSNLADKKFRLAGGDIIQGSNFLDICPHKGVVMAFLGLSTLEVSTPEYEENKDALQSFVLAYINDGNMCD